MFKENNIKTFSKFVLENTNGLGVHFMMADGGFSVEGQENIQEILSKQLYLCQFLVALNIVRVGGNFVCKLFDVFTPFSAGLLYLMYRYVLCLLNFCSLNRTFFCRRSVSLIPYDILTYYYCLDTIWSP